MNLHAQKIYISLLHLLPAECKHPRKGAKIRGSRSKLQVNFGGRERPQGAIVFKGTDS